METTRKPRLKWQNPFSPTVFVYRDQPESINDTLWVQHLDAGKYLWQCRADFKTAEGTAPTMEEAMCAAEDAYEAYLAEQEKHIRTEREKLSAKLTEPKPVLPFKPGDRVVHKQNQKNGTVVKPFGTPFVIADDEHVNCNMDQWELAKKDDPKITLKSGPLEGRRVWSKDFGFGVIYWDDFYSCYKVRRKIGTDGDEDEVYERSFLKPQFELVGDDPVEPKPDDFPREFDTDDRIDALEKRVEELEKKANPQKSEEAIIREFVQWMKEEGWGGFSLHQDTDRYIKEVLNK